MLRRIVGLVLCYFVILTQAQAQTSTTNQPTSNSSADAGASNVAAPSGTILAPPGAPNTPAALTTTPTQNNQIVEIDPVTGKPVVRSAGNEKFRFGGFLVGSYEGSSNGDMPQVQKFASLFALANMTHVPSSLQVRATIARSQNLTYETEGDRGATWTDPTFAIGRPFQVKGLNTFLVRLVGSLPLSVQSQQQKLAGSTGLSTVLGKSWGNFSITQLFNYTRRFYYFEIDKSGRVNSPDSVLSSTTLNYQFTDRLSVSLAATYNYFVSFQNVGRVIVESSVSGSYSLTDHFSVNASVVSSGGTLDSSGQRYQVNTLDQRNITGSVGAAVSM